MALELFGNPSGKLLTLMSVRYHPVFLQDWSQHNAVHPRPLRSSRSLPLNQSDNLWLMPCPYRRLYTHPIFCPYFFTSHASVRELLKIPCSLRHMNEMRKWRRRTASGGFSSTPFSSLVFLTQCNLSYCFTVPTEDTVMAMEVRKLGRVWTNLRHSWHHKFTRILYLTLLQNTSHI